MADGAGLAGQAAAGDRDDDVVLAGPVGDDERLLEQHAQDRAGEIDVERALVDEDLPGPGLIQTRAIAFLRLPVA